MFRLYAFILSTFLAVITLPLLAQSGEGPIYLRGQVVNADDGIGLPSTTLRLFTLQDSTGVTGGLTDEQGNFLLSVPSGAYYLKITFLGYETQFVNLPVLGNTTDTVDLGQITLSAGGDLSLDAVNIEAQGSQMELKLDKRVYTIGQDLSLAGNSADEVLQNLPSIEVDAEGTISLRGSQSVRILINGKPSGLVGNGGDTDGLRNLQASMIEKIEVITNPSARYEAEGEVGIINIILKKEKRKGVNGAFTLGTGVPHNHRLGANLNYRSGKVNLFANLSGNYRNSPGRGSYYQEEYANGLLSLITESTNRRDRQELGGTLQLGADLLFDQYNTLTMSGLVSLGDQLNIATYAYRDFSPDRVPLGTTERVQEEEEIDQNVEFSANYIRTFPQKDRKWTSTLQYQLSDDLEVSDYTQQLIGNGAPILERSSNTENETNLLVQTDYIQPFGTDNEFKVEAGGRANFRTIENDFIVERQGDDGTYTTLEGFDNFFLYQENIYAGYGIFSHEMDRFSYQVGMRAEYTDINIDLIRTNEVIDKNYLNWFPSAFLSYKLKAQNTVQLSYSRRLSRPRFRSLIPFSGLSDARNLRVGNPDLDPEYTHSMEAGYLTYWKSGSLLSSVYFRHRTGVVQRITVRLDDGLTQSMPVNLDTENSVGIELSGSQDITKWWSLSGNVNFFASEINGSVDNDQIFVQAIGFNSRLNSRITLPGKIRFQVSGSYRAPQRSPQGRTLALYSIDLGLTRNVLRGKGTLTFNVSDLLNSRRWQSIVDTETLLRESAFQWRIRQFRLGFTYRLNQENSRGRSQRPGGRGNGGGYQNGDYGG